MSFSVDDRIELSFSVDDRSDSWAACKAASSHAYCKQTLFLFVELASNLISLCLLVDLASNVISLRLLVDLASNPISLSFCRFGLPQI